MAKFDSLIDLIRKYGAEPGMKSPNAPQMSPNGTPYPEYVPQPEAMNPQPSLLDPPASPYGEREFRKNYGDMDPEEVKRLRRLYGI